VSTVHPAGEYQSSFEDFRRPVDRTAAPLLLEDPDFPEIWCPVLSVDDHALEPPDLFTRRVPHALADAAPRVEEDDEGAFWVIEKWRVPITTIDGAAGRPRAQWTMAPAHLSELRRGVWDPKARVADLRKAGVYGSVSFPSTVFGFVGRAFFGLSDASLGRACVQAWNDWMIDEWCAADPGCYVPCQLAWLPDPEQAADEIRANADRGFRALSFSENPEAIGLPSIHTPHWDPLFRACEETGTVINLHVGSSSKVTRPSTDSPRDVTLALFPNNSIVASVDWLFSKIPIRFPGLQIVFSEGGASWVPTVLERLRRTYRQIDVPGGNWTYEDGDPVEVFLRNFSFASLEDPSAFQQLSTIGPDNIMVEADFPHTDSSWPDTQALIRSQTEHLTAEQVRQACFGNAARLYRHRLPTQAELAASVIGGRP
jgi:predicted TIM-barrel fold metal-dependent hydrolase